MLLYPHELSQLFYNYPIKLFVLSHQISQYPNYLEIISQTNRTILISSNHPRFLSARDDTFTSGRAGDVFRRGSTHLKPHIYIYCIIYICLNRSHDVLFLTEDSSYKCHTGKKQIWNLT